MRRWLLLSSWLVLFTETGCDVPLPSPPPTNRLVAKDWTLEFEAAGGSGYLKVRHNLGFTLAELHHVRLILGAARQTFLLGLQSAERRGDALVLTCAPHPDHDIEVRLRLGEAGQIDVEVTDSVGLRSECCELTLDYVLPDLADPDETWLPHQHREPGEVAGDDSFYAPLAFVRRGKLAVALLPDRGGLARHRRIPEAMELDRDAGPRLRHGLINHAPNARGSFERLGPVAVQGETLRFGHTLRVFQDATADTSYELFREMWQKSHVPIQGPSTSLDERCRAFFDSAAADHWIDLSHGKAGAGTFRTERAARRDGAASAMARFSAREQTLRTAYGMLLFAERTGRPDLERKAGRALEQALTAPNRGGLIPSLFRVDAETGEREWLLDSKAADDPGRYHALDVASTCLWMLRLAEHFPTYRPVVLGLCRRTARFFRENQLTNGAFPSFYESEFLAACTDRQHTVPAETGGVALFLTEYGIAAGDDDAITAAQHALEFVRHLLATGVWYDVESVAPAGPRRDTRSGVPRQGTLGLMYCAMATARFGELQRTRHLPFAIWGALCDRLLGQLSRYQQVWSPPWIPDARIGGFGAGNFDCRWNSSRQGLAALAFFAGYRLTDDLQWLERGTAALDAALDVSSGRPRNVTREGFGREFQPADGSVGPDASLHSGPGAACTTAEIARATLGAAVIDMQRAKGLGIDAVWIEDIETLEKELRIRVLTRAADLTRTRIRFRNVPEGLNPMTLTVNRKRVGEFTATQLRDGIEVRPAFVPSFTYLPPKELTPQTAWSPRAIPGASSQHGYGARIEIKCADHRPETYPLVFDADRGILITRDTCTEPRDLPVGATIESRLLFDVAGKTYSEPEHGSRTSRISGFRIVDPGDGDEVDLVANERSEIRRFLDGAEFGRHVRDKGQFTYRVPVESRTNKIEFIVRAAGRIRVRAGVTVLHEDKSTSTVDERRDLEFELADHRLWASGEIPLTFEPVTESDEIDVASIRYRATGQLANIEGLGATKQGHPPEKELRVVVQPFELIDQTLDVGKEALRLAFFGGPDYEITPGPHSHRTFGSVARFIDSLSGGRTAFEGLVLPKRRWNVVAHDLDRPGIGLPDEFLQELRTTHDAADLVVAILGKGSGHDAPMPKPRKVRVGDREVPVVFLHVRSADDSFLSCGAATSAILGASYGIHPLFEPNWGRFGSLALTGADSHLPPGPCGINLARTGWSDQLFLERRDHEKMVISTLESGRVGFVLDCNSLPGRGQLFLERRSIVNDEPSESGVLMYWFFGGEKPQIRNLDGHVSTPTILRLSSVRHQTATPFLAGDADDLFRVASSSLPAATIAGERLWEIRDFRPLGVEQSTFNVRYNGENLITAPSSKWLAGDSLRPWKTVRGWSKSAVRNRDSEVWLTLPKKKGARLRLRCQSTGGLSRLFARVRGIRGRVRVAVGTEHVLGGSSGGNSDHGHSDLVTTDLRSVTERRWLQTDIPQRSAFWIDVINEADVEARVVVGEVTRVPRIRPAHVVRPARVPIARSTRLMDGVTYGRTYRLQTHGKKPAKAKTPVVLPSGPLALRIRAGLPHDSPIDASVELSVTLVTADGSKRTKLLDRQSIRRLGKGNLFLLLAEIKEAAEDRVEFLQLSWRGATDLYLVDFSIVRLR